MMIEYNDDGKKYVAYSVSMEKSIDDFQIRVINANENIGVFNISYRLVDGDSALVYKVSNHMKLKKYIRDYVQTAVGVYEIMIRIMKIIDDSSKYYLNGNRFLIDIDNIYVKNDTKEINLIYIPDFSREENVKNSLIKVQKGMISMFDLSKDFSGSEKLVKLEYLLSNEDNELREVLTQVGVSTQKKHSYREIITEDVKETYKEERRNRTTKNKEKNLKQKTSKRKKEKKKNSTNLSNTKKLVIGVIALVVIMFEIIIAILKLDYLTKTGMTLVLLSVVILVVKKIIDKNKILDSDLLEKTSENQDDYSSYEINTNGRFSEMSSENHIQAGTDCNDDETVLLKASGTVEKRKISVNGQVSDINKKKFTLGRSEKYCDLVIGNDASVGRVHAEIVEIDQDHYIKDMGSVNGTFLNDERIVEGEIKKIEISDVIYLAKAKIEYI